MDVTVIPLGTFAELLTVLAALAIFAVAAVSFIDRFFNR